MRLSSVALRNGGTKVLPTERQTVRKLQIYKEAVRTYKDL